MKRALDISFGSELTVVGRVRLKQASGMGGELGGVAAVLRWGDGFALLADEYFLSHPHEDHGDQLWCFAGNVWNGPEIWNDVRKFASVEAAVGYLDAKAMVAVQK